MPSHISKYFTITFLVLISTFLVWLPFITNYPLWGIPVPQSGMATVVSNYDGPYYIAIAKTLYNPEQLKQFEFNLSAEYYAAHFPLYPLVIKFFSMFMNFPYAMLTATVVFSILAALMFYKLAVYLKLPEPLFLTLCFLVLPARAVITRVVGTPEPQFAFFTLWSIYAFLRGRYWQAGLAGALSVATKPPGILLFAAMGLSLLHDYLSHLKTNPNHRWYQFPWKSFPIVLLPVGLLSVFYLYSHQYGDFLAYFKSGDNIHLFWPPFQMFNSAGFWVGTFWLEDIVWWFIIAAGALGLLHKYHRNLLFYYFLVFFISLCFVEHRDIARYAIPLAPLLIIAYASYLSTPTFRRVFLFILLPIYLYALNFIANNATPISDWTRLL